MIESQLENLISFDVIFFYEEFENIPESMEVIVDPHVFKVVIVVNFVLKQAPNFKYPSSGSQEDPNIDEDWEF